MDLQGGTQVLLEADVAEGQSPPEGAMEAAKSIVENRVNGLGVSEAVVQAQGANRLIVELPGVDNPDQAVETLRSTGQLEFVDPAGMSLSQAMVINTTNRPTVADDLQGEIAAGNATPEIIPYPGRLFETVMTGDVLRNALATQDQFAQWVINFELTGPGSDQFYEYTRTHIGQPMAIVLDGRVLSAPTINAAIRDNGTISGAFTKTEAESLAVQMRYGALPVPLRVVDIYTIGASLGQDSVDSSLRAGIVGHRRRFALHAIDVSLARTFGRRCIGYLCFTQPGDLQIVACDHDLAGYRGLYPVRGYGNRCQHSDFRAYERRVAQWALFALGCGVGL